MGSSLFVSAGTVAITAKVLVFLTIILENADRTWVREERHLFDNVKTAWSMF
jgi:hypothetical protein